MTKIVYSGPFYDPTGYGSASREYVKALYNNGVDVKIIPVNYYTARSTDMIDSQDLTLFKSIEIDNIKSFDYSSYIFINHCTPNAAFSSRINKAFENCKDRWLYSVWETDKIPDEFVSFIEPYGKVLTASEFSKNAFKTTMSNLEVEVVPHIIHNNMYSSYPLHNNILSYKDSGMTIFFANLEWHIGKGYDVLLNGFLNTFKDREDVLLLIKTYDMTYNTLSYKSDIINYIKEVKHKLKCKTPKILPIIGNLSWNSLMGLYNLSDCYISTSRREAFGLTTSEALSFGMPVIAPNKGGHTEFLNENNSLPYDSRWEDVGNLEIERSLYKGQKWIEPDLDSFMEILKKLDNFGCLNTSYELTPFIIDTIDKFSPNEICKKFVNIIER